MITRDSIAADVEFYKTLRSQLRAELRSLPSGHIYYKSMNGYSRPFIRENGKEVYLSQKHKKRIEGLMDRRRIEETVSMLDSNIELLEGVSYDLADISSIIPSIPAGSGRLSNSGINDVSVSAEDASHPISYSIWSRAAGNNKTSISPDEEHWLSENAGTPNYGGRHTTSDGIAVKSRVELILYEYFKSLGLVFMYERAAFISELDLLLLR